MNFHRDNLANLVSTVVISIMALLAIPAYSQSEAIIVDSPADGDDGDFSPGNLTLREAVGFANTTPSDVIHFDPGLAGATITLTEGQLEISSSMTIEGLGADALTISADGASRVIAEVKSGQRIITIRDLTLSDGLAPSSSGGGALFSNGANITLERVVMRNNNSLGSSGSTIVAAFGTLIIRNCAIVDNLDRGVGAIRLQDNQTTITNTTISNNQTRAISFFSASESRADLLSLTNVTISGNGGNSGIEIVANAGTTDFEYQNTILADNGSANIAARGNALPGLSITSLGNNLLDDSPAGDAAHSASAGDQRDTNPLLDPLDDYGGSTFTLRPGLASTAINAGLCFADDPLVPEADQRGVARPQGDGCDIGAVEVAHVSVSFNADGGVPAPEAQALIEGDLVAEPTAMTRSGFIFKGWYDTPDFSGAPWNFASDTVPFDALVLFARWESDEIFSDAFEEVDRARVLGLLRTGQ